jgi:hypothetical protein
MSNSNATCNGSNLNATLGIAVGKNGGGAGCGNASVFPQASLARAADNEVRQMTQPSLSLSGGSNGPISSCRGCGVLRGFGGQSG